MAAHDGPAGCAPSNEPEMPRIGFVRMDNSTRTLLGPVRNVHLSGTEWRLLRQLSSAHGGVVSHEQLLSAIWGSGYSTAHHLLHDAVSRLRHRFNAAGVERVTDRNGARRGLPAARRGRSLLAPAASVWSRAFSLP